MIRLALILLALTLPAGSQTSLAQPACVTIPKSELWSGRYCQLYNDGAPCSTRIYEMWRSNPPDVNVVMLGYAYRDGKNPKLAPFHACAKQIVAATPALCGSDTLCKMIADLAKGLGPL